MNSLEPLISELSNELKVRAWKLATAESCTGGGLAYYITEISGSSTWFERGFVTYSNEAKIDLLGVSLATLNEFGAVSKQTAHEMAIGALENSEAEISVAITGIAGPDGGTDEKPVGTVWFACAGMNQETEVRLVNFSGNRQEIRFAAIRTAVLFLLEFIKNGPAMSGPL